MIVKHCLKKEREREKKQVGSEDLDSEMLFCLDVKWNHLSGLFVHGQHVTHVTGNMTWRVKEESS